MKDKALLVINQLSSDKATAGNVKKLRSIAINMHDDDKDIREVILTTANMMERDLSRKAANRRLPSYWVNRLIGFDWQNIPGCIGFEKMELK